MTTKLPLDELLEYAKTLGLTGLTLAADELRKIAPKTELEKLLLAALADAIAQGGSFGLAEGVKALRSLLDGGGVAIDFSDLRESSDILALLQRAEAGEKEAAAAMLSAVGEKAGAVFAAVLRGFIAG